MSKRKDLIRRGDYVKIINPEIVLRWGYTLTKEIVKDKLITDEQRTVIRSLIGHRTLPEPFFTRENPRYVERAYEKMIDELAYVILKRNGFGGKNRQLFTETRESLRNARGYVNQKKVVKTGEYYPPYYHPGDGWEYEADWEPGGLKYESTHVLCRLSVFDGQPGVCAHINENGGVWIDRVNLAKEEGRTSW